MMTYATLNMIFRAVLLVDALGVFYQLLSLPKGTAGKL
ncbi:hypothetical protein AO369_0139 [Moraxella catarrhalis]|nr:hypothetical protein AO369_0139 [Moraxella catarrhalis]